MNKSTIKKKVVKKPVKKKMISKSKKTTVTKTYSSSYKRGKTAATKAKKAINKLRRLR